MILQSKFMHKHYWHGCCNIENGSNHGKAKHNDPIYSSWFWTCLKGG
jgi:hypothetical protein